MKKTPFRERSAREQAQIVGIIAVSVVVVALAQNDLRRRPRNQVRGSKTLWRVVSLNALGAVIYLCFGRVRSRQ